MAQGMVQSLESVGQFSYNETELGVCVAFRLVECIILKNVSRILRDSGRQGCGQRD